MRILVTGAAGFIGFHATRALLARGHVVTGIDELNAYYDPALKRARLAEIGAQPNFRFVQADIADAVALATASGGERYEIVLHLAAQAGVRRGLTDPASYTRSNLVGQQVMLEFARRAPHRIYNLGNSHPEDVMSLIRILEQATGIKAKIESVEAPPGDVRETYADITRAARDFGFHRKSRSPKAFHAS